MGEEILKREGSKRKGNMMGSNNNSSIGILDEGMGEERLKMNFNMKRKGSMMSMTSSGGGFSRPRANSSPMPNSSALRQMRPSFIQGLHAFQKQRASCPPDMPLEHLQSLTRSSLLSSHIIGKKDDDGGKPSLTGMLIHGDKHGLNTLSHRNDPVLESVNIDPKKILKCGMCADPLLEQDDGGFVPCECGFRLCTACLEHVKRHEKNLCPYCMKELFDKETWLAMQQDEEESENLHNLNQSEKSTFKNINKGLEINQSRDTANLVKKAESKSLEMVVVRKSPVQYGYGTAAWDGSGNQDKVTNGVIADIKKRGLFRRLKFPARKIGPYRLLVFIRFVSSLGFLEFRVTEPSKDVYWLWIISLICEIWFFFSWILDTMPKLTPVYRETHLDRLAALCGEDGQEFPQVDVFITTADALKEPPLVTACTILSVLSVDYPANRLACYLSDDGSSKLMFDTMAEVAEFARLWLSFRKRFDIEPPNPEAYFSERIDYTKDQIQPEFVKSRRKVKREFEEFKVRINKLVAESGRPPADGWKMEDERPWPGNNRRDHDGIIQVFLHPDTNGWDTDGNAMPPLVYVSREKRPGHEHNKKAGAMNALVRASALITNGMFLLNLDCDHFINNSKALREALCFFLDPIRGHNIGYVQFPQRFDGIDKNDRYANRNTVFFDINMKGLDGLQGPVYVGTGCMFRRKALYGYMPSKSPSKRRKKGRTGKSACHFLYETLCCCFQVRKESSDSANSEKTTSSDEYSGLIGDRGGVSNSEPLFKMGTCSDFTATTVPGGEECAPSLDVPKLLSDCILVISSDYEDNTDWGKQIGWMYGSVTEDILTGMKVHTRGWKSVYCDPIRAAFKGSAPLNMTDRLVQVERWATGAVEIFLSKRNPLWAEWGTRLRFRQRIAYANNAFYPFTSIAIFMYCLLGPLSLMADSFFIPTLNTRATIWFTILILSIIACSLLELYWSNVTFDAWWRNEQFWVVSGLSSHLAAIMSGIMKLFGGSDISFTLTSKGSGDGEDIDELHTFKFTWLLLVPAFVLTFNVLAIVIGIARVTILGESWSNLVGKLVFIFWVIIHMYPFAKGMLGRRDRLPTIIIVWSVLVLIVISLMWTTFFKPNFSGGRQYHIP